MEAPAPARALGRSSLLALLASAVLPARGLLISSWQPEADDADSLPAPALDGQSFMSAEVAVQEVDALLDAGWREDRAMLGSNGSAESRMVPPIQIYAVMWQRFWKFGLEGATMHLNKQTFGKRGTREGQPIKMALGIFTTYRKVDEPYRNAIRKTWMKQPWICQIEDIADPPGDCQVFVAFVIARGNGYPGHVNGTRPVETDIVVLDEKEQMNCGKTRAWFAYASEKYGAATHIAKMDMDAWVDIAVLLELEQALRAETDCPYVYGGRPWHCPEDFCPKLTCGGPRGTDYYADRTGSPDCWTYMQGGFYFMSKELAASVSATNGWWHERSSACLAEDTVTGKAVDRWGKENQRCVAALDLRGQGVIWHPDRPDMWLSRYHKPE